MEQKINFILNNTNISDILNPAMTLLDYIRIDAGLKGTKEGCREGDCGACTVLIGELVEGKLKYKSANSCLLPIGNINGCHVVTIEGLNDESLTPVQHEFNEEGASQCGFCTPGFVNSLTGYVIENNTLNKVDAKNAIAGNICRCTGYASITRSTDNLIDKINKLKIDNSERIESLISAKIIPQYFSTIELRLKELESKNNSVDKNTIRIGGGTDLFVQKPDTVLNTSVSFIKDLQLTEICILDDYIQVGSGVTIEQFKNSEIIKDNFPSLFNQLELFASLPIRNSATIGGNIVNASPIGDSTAIFIALDSTLIISSVANKREVKLNEFYKGYKNIDLVEDEYVEKILFKLPSDSTKFNFEKVSKREYLDIASVNTAMKIDSKDGIIKSVHLSAGGVSPIPLFLKRTSEFLTDKVVGTKTLLEAIKTIETEISPISDIRGSADYKARLLTQLFKAHFIKLFPDLIVVEELL